MTLSALNLLYRRFPARQNFNTKIAANILCLPLIKVRELERPALLNLGSFSDTNLKSKLKSASIRKPIEPRQVQKPSENCENTNFDWDFQRFLNYFFRQTLVWIPKMLVISDSENYNSIPCAEKFRRVEEKDQIICVR